jgi:hypothetical protein
MRQQRHGSEDALWQADGMGHKTVIKMLAPAPEAHCEDGLKCPIVSRHSFYVAAKSGFK